MSICTGCHNGHISASCPIHGSEKTASDEAARRYTEQAMAGAGVKDPAKALTLARAALRRAAYSLNVHGAKEVSAQCAEALRALGG